MLCARAYSQPYQTSKMEYFAKIANGWKLQLYLKIAPSYMFDWVLNTCFLYTYLPLGNINTSILSDSSLCSGRTDGNYALIINNVTFQENFLSCVHGIAYCRFCPDANGPILHYSEECDQCLYPADAGKHLLMQIWYILINYLGLIEAHMKQIIQEWTK